MPLLGAMEAILVFDNELLLLPVEYHLCNMIVLLEELGIDIEIVSVYSEFVEFGEKPPHNHEISEISDVVNSLVHIECVSFLLPENEVCVQPLFFNCSTYSKTSI